MDNAKKYVETGHLGGTETEVYGRLVAYDNLGDPMKDTAAPIITSYAKLVIYMAIIFSGFILSHSIFN